MAGKLVSSKQRELRRGLKRKEKRLRPRKHVDGLKDRKGPDVVWGIDKSG